MKIAVFFTYDYGVETLIKAGIFERELKVYKNLNKKHDIDFKFFTYDVNNPYVHENFEFVSIYQHINRPKNKYLRLINSFLIPFKLKKNLLDCDLIHQHQLHGVWISLLINFLTKKPLLVRTGYDAYQFSINNKENFINRSFNRIITKYALKYADLYTVTSNEDFQFLKNKFNKIKQISIVPNWIEENRVNNEKKLTNRILMVGRLEKQKNYLEAINFLEFNNSYTIDIVGTGAERKLIESVANKYNLKINFLENLNHEKLIKLYPKYYYFLSTSIFEGNPKSILEALNSGCIVFASNIANHRELIKDQLNGILYDNIDELIKKFNLVVQNKVIQERISLNAKNSVKKNSIENIVQTMYKDYCDLILDK